MILFMLAVLGGCLVTTGTALDGWERSPVLIVPGLVILIVVVVQVLTLFT